MGFFGLYEATLTILPGLPPIEVSQFYILLTFIKVNRIKKLIPIFYYRFAIVLGVYLIILIIYSYIIGRTGGFNVHFRLAKITIPFLLFYTLPQLLSKEIHYRRFFSFIFPFGILVFVAQVINIYTGKSPALMLGFLEAGTGGYIGFDFAKHDQYRGFYSPQTILVSFIGALFYLAYNPKKGFTTLYLWVVAGSLYLACFLSATRGWIIGLGIPFILFLFFIYPIRIKTWIPLIIALSFLVWLGSTSSNVYMQMEKAVERTLTLKSLAKGDITAGGTLKRLDQRAPLVLENWKKSPLFGWGFSDNAHIDGHVSHPSILARSGIVGYTLLNIFILYILLTLWRQSTSYNPIALKRGLKVFPIFFIGWFFLHSTSGQQFGYSILPAPAITQAIFLAFASTMYNQSKIINKINGILPTSRIDN